MYTLDLTRSFSQFQCHL